MLSRPRDLPAKPVWAVLIALVLIASACENSTDRAGHGRVLTRLAPVSQLATNPSNYFGLAWLPNGKLVVNRDAPGKDVRAELWLLDPNTGEFAPIDLRTPSTCLKADYHAPITLPDGRLGVVLECSFKIKDRLPGVAMSLVTASLKSGLTRPLITDESWQQRTGGFAVAEDMTEALVALGDELCGTVALIDREGIQPLDVTVGGGGATWNLASYFGLVEEDDSCWAQGRAASPAWSPEAGAAFFASPQSAGVEGLMRVDVPWNLYLMKPLGTDLRLLIENVRYPHSLTWSPSGEWLLFVGQPRGQSLGAWLYSMRAQTLVRIADAGVGGFTWSREGDQAAAIEGVSATKPSPLSRLVILDLSRIDLGELNRPGFLGGSNP